MYIKDKLRGIIKFNIFELEDKILFRSNGMPTYHFASVIDDYTMNITHVIRGEEWISSTPIHVIIYNYFKWKLPEFIHLPLILDPNQKGKLSKRNILTYNFPIFPIKWYNKKKNNYINGFKEHGFLGDAITNWLFILGYSNPLKEIFYNIEDLIKEFDINKINSVNTILDINKIIWLNKSHINNKSSIELHELCNDLYQLDNNILSPKLIDIIKNRCTLLSDIIDISKSIIIRPNINKNDITFKLWNNDIAIFFKKICNLIERNELDINDLIKFIKINNLNIKNNLIIILRVIITGKSKGPNINDIINFLGKKEIILRIKIALISLE
ncbi:MAG: hypothetical protein IR527_00885 [Bacteroides sp.]|nr:MAG: hypothetical protein IR527_00885 [Bacteroides sp.]